MRRVLIAGCGYLGQATADVFETAGWEVEGWTNSSKSARKLSAKHYRVDALDISNARQVAARPGNFDAVIHCASTRGGDVDLYRSVYLIGTCNLLDRFPEAKILFTSSTSVYAQSNGEWVTEESPAEPNQETGKILREAEQLVLARDGNVARLGGIYGPGRSFLLRKFLGGEAIVDPERDRFVNQIHRDDAAAAALFLVVCRQLPGGGIYNVVDDRPILQSECYRWLAERLNRPAPPFGRSASKRKRGESNKRVSNAKLRALGWVPRYSTFAKAMGKSILPAAGLGQ
jgi:nucleoside-diphosphate-sugar epimerase